MKKFVVVYWVSEFNERVKKFRYFNAKNKQEIIEHLREEEICGTLTISEIKFETITQPETVETS